MSIKLMTQVWALPVHEKCKLVLLSLADQANDDGVCWPDIDTIAARCSVSTKTVQRAISALETDGWLSVKREYGKAPIFRVILDDKPGEKSPERAPDKAPELPADSGQKSEKDKLSKSENSPGNLDKLSIDLDKLSNSHTRTVIEPSLPLTPSPSADGLGAGLPGFERWWQTYPKARRVAKSKCLRIWRSRQLEPRTERIIRVLLDDACSPQWVKDSGQFVPMPATWLGQERYEREIGSAAAMGGESKLCSVCGVRGIFTLGQRRYCEQHYEEKAA